MAKNQLKSTLLSLAFAVGLALGPINAGALSLGISGRINKTIG
jgi:hypothetical protein